MNTNLKASLFLTIGLFLSNDALAAHCNELAIIVPSDVKKITISNHSHLRNPNSERVGNVLLLERLHWFWDSGGTEHPQKADILMEKADGSLLKARVQQGYCNWLFNQIADNDVSIIDMNPIPNAWKTPQKYRAEHRDAPGRIAFE